MKIKREHLGAALLYAPLALVALAPGGWAVWPAVILVVVVLAACIAAGVFFLSR